jgi:hypothetical protein
MAMRATRKVRAVTYCGAEYTVAPSVPHARTQYWTILVNGTQVLTEACPSLSKASAMIHAHAVATGQYARAYEDAVRDRTALPALSSIIRLKEHPTLKEHHHG